MRSGSSRSSRSRSSARTATVIGVISMHTEAPREFTEDEVEFLVSSASLVAGAIENARLYEESRRRVGELEHLRELGEAIAAAETLDDLLPAGRLAVAASSCGADACRLYLLDPSSEQLQLRASAPPGAESRAAIPLTELGPELSRRGQAARVAIPLVASDELLGVLQAQGTAEVDLARAVANQTAVAIKKIELIERLTEKNLIKDFFEQLAGGKVLGELEGRAARLGCDLDQPYLVIAASPADDRFEKALRSAASGSLFDRRDDSMRALLRVPSGGGPRLLETLRGVQAELGGSVAIGVSNVCTGAASFRRTDSKRRAMRSSATTVLLAQPSVMTYDELGPYKYLLRDVARRRPFATRTSEAVARLADYDRERSTSLFRTLEEFLHRRGNISATAEALFVHPNTLRQRLRRIMEISRARPPPGRLADGRDRGQAREAPGSPRDGTSRHIGACAPVEKPPSAQRRTGVIVHSGRGREGRWRRRSPRAWRRSDASRRSAGSSSISRSSSTCTPARARSSFRRRISTTSSPTAPASPGSPPARSDRCRAIPTSLRSPICAASRRSRGSRSLARFACDITVEGEEWPY